MSEIYKKHNTVPNWALRKIEAGRLKGKSDINPQWRYEVLDEMFGVCGIGWKYELVDFFTLAGGGDEVAAFAKINLYIKQDGKWSDAIPGFGGSMLVEREKTGLHTNDEALKMAVTDALSVACKMLGIGADIYKGLSDSKYNKPSDFSKTATNDKRALTNALKKEELPQRTEEKLKADFTTTLQHLVNIKSFDNLNNTQIDFINRLLKELHDRNFTQQYEQLSILFTKLQNEQLQDNANL